MCWIVSARTAAAWAAEKEELLAEIEELKRQLDDAHSAIDAAANADLAQRMDAAMCGYVQDLWQSAAIRRTRHRLVECAFRGWSDAVIDLKMHRLQQLAQEGAAGAQAAARAPCCA